MSCVRTLAVVVLLIPLVSLARAGEGRWDSPVPVEEIKAMVKHLESNPLAEDADGLRAFLLKYFDSMRPEFSVCLTQFKPLLDAKSKDDRELWIHIPIASGAYLLDHPQDLENKAAYQLAGLEGLVRVYEVIVAAKPSRRNAFLDQLVLLRKENALAAYVREHMCPGDSSSHFGPSPTAG